MADSIIEQLPDASWRGILFPYTGTRTYGFQHEQTEHRIIFRDEELIESIGRTNPTFRFTIPFREGVRQYGWANLFTEVYPKFLAACLDRSAGMLVDSVHGEVRCKCASLTEELDVEKTDGVDVSAAFIYAPEAADDVSSNFTSIAGTLTGLEAATVAYNQVFEGLTAEQKAQIKELNPPLQKARISPINVVRAAAASVQRYKTQTRAILGQTTDQLERAARDLEEARDPELVELRRESARLAKANRDLAKIAANPTTPFDVARIATEIGRIAFATSKQMTVDVLIEFNPWAADRMTFLPGDEVIFPRRNGGT
jgi:hypothetical protein